MKFSAARYAVLAAASLLLSLGCTKPAARQPTAKTPAPAAVVVRPPDLQLSGKIIRVNATEGYVVAECAVLPKNGEEARVLRGENEIGRVRFTGPFSFPYAVGDVTGGQPAAGDRIRK